ncbi:MAG: capsule assembly Wzi family protein [Pseudoflavonifractor sp.]|nr:capsule assembly Wzi family protein [Alloprevotella sp.]MCM1116232.1 capsule assembly Wzi family protein [Pseudoflavonifractor sp.]
MTPLPHLRGLLLPLIALLCVAVPTRLKAHEPQPVTYEAEVLATTSTGRNTPFWLVANREGLGSIRQGEGYVRACVARSALGTSRLGWGFGAELVGAWRADAPIRARQLYADLRYRHFLLSIGSKSMADTARLVDRRLSSGDLLFSGNALPIPEARLSMPHYLDIPGLRHWLGIKAYISYGITTDSRFLEGWTMPDGLRTSGVRFHTKGIFFRVGPQGRPFTFEGGLEMAAQFGGKLYKGDSLVIDMPNGLKEHWKVLFPGSGGADAPTADRTNVLGNHLGEWSARLTWRPGGRPWHLEAYYLHFFDDHSMMFFDHPWKDGLFGLSYHNPSGRWITGAAYEFLSTTDQSGPIYWDSTPEVPEQVSGQDNYYNNVIYQAYQHWGMGIGNPLIISPIYNADHTLRFQCNRVRGHHWAIEGQPLPELGYRILTSYTRGWGTYKRPYRDVRSCVNLLVEAAWSPRRLNGWTATLGLAADWGRLIGRSFGLSLSISKTGLLTHL